jgi:hypothetical protein
VSTLRNLWVLGTDTASTLTASPNPALPRQPITFTATVSGLQSRIPPTGAVTFKDGPTTLGAVTVGTNGVASFGNSTLLTGTHPITAIYGGSTDYKHQRLQPSQRGCTAIPTNIGLSLAKSSNRRPKCVTVTATAVSGPPNQTPPSPLGSIRRHSSTHRRLATTQLVHRHHQITLLCRASLGSAPANH